MKTTRLQTYIFSRYDKSEIQTNSIVETFITDKDIDMKGNKYELYYRNNLIERYSDKYTVGNDLFDERTIYHDICIKMRDNINVAEC